MRHTIIYSFGLALALSMSNLIANPETERDPFASTPKTEAEIQEEKVKRDVLTIRVILERDGKEIGSYTAYASQEEDGDNVFSAGVISTPEKMYWKIRVNADLRQLNYSSLRVDVEDLNLFKRNSDGETVPIEIFSTSLQSKGLGEYTCGVVQGMTLRVVIAKAEP